MKSKIINIACLTASKHALRNTLPTIMRSENLRLIAIYSRHKKKNLIISKKFKCKVFNDYKLVLKMKELDAVYIASSNNLHFKFAKESILSKKNVLLEKPATINLYQAKTLSNLAIKNNVVLMEGFMYRFHNQFVLLKEIIKNEKVTKIESSFGFPHLPKNNMRYKKELGGGALLDAGCYTISSIISLSQENFKLEKSSLIKKNYDVDIKGNAIFRTTSNKRYIANWFFGGAYKNEIKITMSDFSIKVERAFSKPSNLKTQIKFYKQNNLMKTIFVNKDDHFMNMFNYFHRICFNKNMRIIEINNLIRQSRIIEKIRLRDN